MIIHNEEIRDLVKTRYTPADIERIRDLLDRHRALRLPALSGGLFPAALITPETRHTGYANVWVRDNVHVAHALLMTGRVQEAVRTARALAAHFERQRDRFEAVIADPASATEAMNRPHIRFDGAAERDIEETWPHAQNDALGYFLWFYCRLARNGLVTVGEREAEMLARFPRYFSAIRYWEDEDSGHWEEVRRISASSIGAVTAGLRELKTLLARPAPPAALRARVRVASVDALLSAGRARLNTVLPFECLQPDPRKKRLYDAALLFLIHPLDVAEGPAADGILANIAAHLQGDFGIRRYPGDSFWSADYWKNFKAEDRTGDLSCGTALRDRFFIPGTEAQWCIFDPIVSVIYGNRYQRFGRIEDRHRQILHLNRSLGQITGENARCGFGPGQIRIGPFQCPELYHVETVESGAPEVQPSEATPLLWTRANLSLALGVMARSLRKTHGD